MTLRFEPRHEDYFPDLEGYAHRYNVEALSGECQYKSRIEPEPGNPLWVPCGKCLRCNSLRKNEMVGRMLAEAVDHEHSCVLTLTFKDHYYHEKEDNPEWRPSKNWLKMPCDWTKEDVLAENDLLRRRIKYHWPEWPGRYFVCWEKGERNGRLHCHIILFGIPRPPAKRQQVVVPFWKYGIVYEDKLSPASCGYVADYLTNLEKKPLRIHSRGSDHLGHRYQKQIIEELAGLRPWRGLALTKLRKGRQKSALFELDHKTYAITRSLAEYAKECGIYSPGNAVSNWLEDRVRLVDTASRPGMTELQLHKKQDVDYQALVRRFETYQATRQKVLAEIDGYQFAVSSRPP